MPVGRRSGARPSFLIEAPRSAGDGGQLRAAPMSPGQNAAGGHVGAAKSNGTADSRRQAGHSSDGAVHRRIPALPRESRLAFELLVGAYSLLVVGVQLVNIYNSGWWLPESSVSYALHLNLIEPVPLYVCLFFIVQRFVKSLLELPLTDWLAPSAQKWPACRAGRFVFKLNRRLPFGSVLPLLHLLATGSVAVYLIRKAVLSFHKDTQPWYWLGFECYALLPVLIYPVFYGILCRDRLSSANVQGRPARQVRPLSGLSAASCPPTSCPPTSCPPTSCPPTRPLAGAFPPFNNNNQQKLCNTEQLLDSGAANGPKPTSPGKAVGRLRDLGRSLSSYVSGWSLCAFFKRSLNYVYLLYWVLVYEQSDVEPTTAHACPSSASRAREQAQILIDDLNYRLGRVLFGAWASSFYAALLPMLSAPSHLFYEVEWTGQFVVLSFAGLLIAHWLHFIPAKYLDLLHQCSFHLGCWQKVDASRLNPSLLPPWSDEQFWPKGSLAKTGSAVFRAAGPFLTSARPGCAEHDQFFRLFSQPRKVYTYYLAAVWLLFLFMFGQLLFSTNWNHLVTLGLLCFTNLYLLFKVTRDWLALGKAYGWPTQRQSLS